MYLAFDFLMLKEFNILGAMKKQKLKDWQS